MSVKLNRYYSNEAGSFTKSGINRFNIDIPASVGFTDLHNSALVLRMKITDDTGGLYPYTFVSPNETATWDDVQGAQSLIRNCKVTSDRYGVLHEQLRQNVVGANLDWMRKGREQQDANVSFGDTWSGSGYGVDRLSGMAFSPFLLTGASRPVAVGDQYTVNTLARLTTPEIRIPLRHLDRLADGTRPFPNLAVSNLRYHVELENQLDVVGCPTIFQQDGVMQELEDVTCDVNGNVDYWTWTGYVGGAYQPLVQNIAAMASVPLYVGCPILMTYTINATFTVTQQYTVSELWVDEATGEVRFRTFEQPAQPNAQLTDITYDFAEPVNPRWEIIEASIELCELQLSKPQLKAAMAAMENLVIPFYDYDLQVQPLSETTDFNQILQAPANSVACIAFTPEMQGLVSKLDHAYTYRRNRSRWVHQLPN